MSRSHPSTSPNRAASPHPPNDPYARLLGADERIVPRPAFRASLRERLLTFAPAPGVPIDAPLLGRVIVRPVHALVAAAVGVAAVAGALALRPADRDVVVPPPPVQRMERMEPAAQPPVSAARSAASVLVRPPSSAADRRATITERRTVDRPGPRRSGSAAGTARDVALVPAPRRPVIAIEAAAAGIDAPPAPPALLAPAGDTNTAPPSDPSGNGGRDRERDRDRDRGRSTGDATATATAAIAEPPGGAEATSPALLPPEPAEPTQVPPAAMPTVPVAPTPPPGP